MSEIYKLAYPIERRTRVAGGAENVETITEVEVRRVNGADMRWMSSQADASAKGLGLVARLTGLHSTAVDLMDAEDIAGISEVVAGFLPAGLATGETS